MAAAISESTVAPGRVQPCPMGVRHVLEDIDFVYVMRRDTEYIAGQFAARLEAPGALDETRAAYDVAVDALAESILRAFATVRKSPAVDILDSGEVHRRRLELLEAVDGLVISMDPLMEDGALPLAFSRCYRPGGVDFVEMIPRPGYPPLEQQVERIAAAAGGRPLVVVEDDFYTGGTLATTLTEHLGPSLAARIDSVITGTRIGQREQAFPIHAAVTYRREAGLDPLEKVDLGDPRDYVIGASGLVCKLESGRLGRLPYVLPFVSPAARASLPEPAEVAFSREALELSRAFYADLSSIAGKPVTVDVVDPAFAVACQELLGVRPGTPMADVLDAIERSGSLAY